MMECIQRRATETIPGMGHLPVRQADSVQVTPGRAFVSPLQDSLYEEAYTNEKTETEHPAQYFSYGLTLGAAFCSVYTRWPPTSLLKEPCQTWAAPSPPSPRPALSQEPPGQTSLMEAEHPTKKAKLLAK